MKKAIWTIEAVITKEGEIVDLGGSPKGGLVFGENMKPLYFIEWDGHKIVDIDDVVTVTECGHEYPIDEYLRDVDFEDLLEQYEG